jgi:hypothetical protein
MTKYLSRAAATKLVRDQGVEIGDKRLADLASQRRGPRYVMINGRACYTEQWLLEWIEREAAQPVERCGRGRAQPRRAVA